MGKAATTSTALDREALARTRRAAARAEHISGDEHGSEDGAGWSIAGIACVANGYALITDDPVLRNRYGRPTHAATPDGPKACEALAAEVLGLEPETAKVLLAIGKDRRGPENSFTARSVCESLDALAREGEARSPQGNGRDIWMGYVDADAEPEGLHPPTPEIAPGSRSSEAGSRCPRCGLDHQGGACLFDEHPELLGPRITGGQQRGASRSEVDILAEERTEYLAEITREAERAQADAQAGQPAEWALMQACIPLLVAGECGELDAATLIIAGHDALDAVRDEDAQDREQAWRTHAEQRRHPDVTRMWSALDQAVGERDAGWSDEKRSGAVNWLGCAREMAMVQRTPPLTAQGSEQLAEIAGRAWRASAASGLARAVDGTLVWDGPEGERRTFAGWIAECAGEMAGTDPIARLRHAHLTGATLPGNPPVGLSPDACIDLAEAAGEITMATSGQEKLRKGVLRWPLMQAMGLEGDALAERSLATAEHAGETARDRLGGQSDAFFEALARGCATARASGGPVGGGEIEEAMSLREPSPFSAPWSNGAEKAAETDAALDEALRASDAARTFEAKRGAEARSPSTTEPVAQALEDTLARSDRPVRACAAAEHALRNGTEPDTGHAPLDEAIRGNAWAYDRDTLERLADAAREAEATARQMQSTHAGPEAHAVRTLARGGEDADHARASPLARAALARASAGPCLGAPPQGAVALARVTMLRASGRTARADAEQSVRWAETARAGGAPIAAHLIARARNGLEGHATSRAGMEPEALERTLVAMGEGTARAACEHALAATQRALEQAGKGGTRERARAQRERG